MTLPVIRPFKHKSIIENCLQPIPRVRYCNTSNHKYGDILGRYQQSSLLLETRRRRRILGAMVAILIYMGACRREIHICKCRAVRTTLPFITFEGPSNEKCLPRYMMHRKALLFAGPSHPISQELEKGWKLHPRDVRDLGRKIPNFTQEAWEQNRFAIVVEGNYLKFSQNAELKQKLLATCNRELVEASPRDRIWGVGFGAKNAGANRSGWGLNLLGKALMETRERLLTEEAGNKNSSKA